jgi:nitroreductase
MNTYIENLNWRYATKLFDNSKSVSEEELNKILEAIQLSASSYGLQPYKILVIEDKELKEKLKLAAFNQPQLTDASHILVFANYTSIDENYINAYIENIAETRNTTSENLKGFKNMLTGSILSLKSEDQNQWAAKQTYIALGNLLSAAAALKIDACPMEGFDTEKFDNILGLKEKGLTTAAIATIGYRSEADKSQHAPKVRKNKTELFNRL